MASTPPSFPSRTRGSTSCGSTSGFVDAAQLTRACFRTLEHACMVAVRLNAELDEYCSAPVPQNNLGFVPEVSQRFLAFGVLPLVPVLPTSPTKVASNDDEDDPESRAEAIVSAVLDAIVHITDLKHLRGVIIGTKGLGKGLDDPRLAPIWEALDESGLIVFIHPHYGVTPAKGPESEFGEVDNGHVLPLALGFPMETAIVRFACWVALSLHADAESRPGRLAAHSVRRPRPAFHPQSHPRPRRGRPPLPFLPTGQLRRTRPASAIQASGRLPRVPGPALLRRRCLLAPLCFSPLRVVLTDPCRRT